MRSTHMFIRMSSLVLVILVTFACFTQALQDEDPAIPIVKNGAAPAEGLQVIRLEEMWRAGGEDDEIIFGHIFRAEGDADGNVYLLDTQLSEVPIFSPDGEHVKTLSREGEGPGVTREPVDLTLLADGILGILQRFPDMIVRIDMKGTPLGIIPIGDAKEDGFNSLYSGRCKGENLMGVGQYATLAENMQTRPWFAPRYDADGNELVKLWERACVIDFTNPVIRELDILDPAMFDSIPGPAEAFLTSNVFDADGRLQRDQIHRGQLERYYIPERPPGRSDLFPARLRAGIRQGHTRPRDGHRRTTRGRQDLRRCASSPPGRDRSDCTSTTRGAGWCARFKTEQCRPGNTKSSGVDVTTPDAMSHPAFIGFGW